MVNPQFSIAADETSQMGIQEQIVGTISQESVQQRADEQNVVVRVPTVQEQRFIPDIPRAQVVKRIRGKRAHQRTVEQNVRAPVPVQEQSFVPEKPEAQGVEQKPKTLDRLLGESELEKEEAYWNEFCEDEDNIEQLYQEWLSGAFEHLFSEVGRRERKSSKKKKNWIVRFRFWNGFRNTLWCPLIRRRNSTTSSFNVGPVFTMDDSEFRYRFESSCCDWPFISRRFTQRPVICFLHTEFVVDRLG